MRRLLRALTIAAVLWSAAAEGANPDQFLVKNAGDLVAVCETPESDPYYAAAIGFCHGYVVGAYQYHQALYTHGRKHKAIFCEPNPRPSRAQAIRDFVAWVNENPKYKSENAVETMFKYLMEKWPCPK
jgi:hypothetical protein